MYESSSSKTKNGQPHVVSNLYDFYLWNTRGEVSQNVPGALFIQKKWMGTNVVKLKKDKNSFLYVIHTPFLILYTSFVWESDWNCMHLFILYSVSEPFWL